MIRRWVSIAGLGMLAFVASCGKKSSTAGSGNSAVPQAVAEVPVASHLGFATKVPRDADLFVEGFHAAQMLDHLVVEVMKLGEGKPDAPLAEREEDLKKFREGLSYVGDEAFLFVGPGLGSKLTAFGETYRDSSAAMTGVLVSSLLDGMNGKATGLDPSKVESMLPKDLMDRWIKTLENDSRLTLPSVVVGWKPGEGKQEEVVGWLKKKLKEAASDIKSSTPVEFNAEGVALGGFEIPGREAFGEAIAKARESMKQEEDAAKFAEQIDPEQIERLLTALENVRITVAAGLVDGRVLIYLGNGSEGFHLARTPEDSLATTMDLKWTHEFAGKPIAGVAYLSEAMVGSALPWLDSSPFWESLSRAVRPPLRDERMFRQLLTGLADNGRELGKRDVRAWSAVVVKDLGIRLETRGGWPDPSIDFVTPLSMTSAAGSLQPAIRVHWIQNRERMDLEWKRYESLGLLLDSVLGECRTSFSAMNQYFPEESQTRLFNEIREMNRAYREDFRAGIGDEVAIFMDFLGEVPPVPGISEEVVRTAKAPRFVVASPVKNRASIEAAGKSHAKSWKNLTEWATELSGENLPLIMPQAVESNGMTTWYPPLPFIGGDFLPGVTMNDQLWMLGTSRSMVSGFADGIKKSGKGGETGMIIEIDFAPIRAWLADLYQRNEEEAEELMTEATAEMDGEKLTTVYGMDVLERMRKEWLRLQGISYRKWMADGSPRSSLHVRMSP